MSKFPLEKILTMSVTEYCQMQNKKLSDYRAEGIHLSKDDIDEDDINLVKLLRKYVPKNTEAVVNFGFFVSGCDSGDITRIQLYATALIPKRKKALIVGKKPSEDINDDEE